MKVIYTEIEIYAPKEKIWNALIDKPKWLEWNTLVIDMDPSLPLQLGKKFSMAVAMDVGKKGMKFQPVVTEYQVNKSFRWIGKIPGFQGEHCFELDELAENKTLFKHFENFNGFLAIILLFLFRNKFKAGYERMNLELKKYVESN